MYSGRYLNMINELFRKMAVAQIFSALSRTVCMLVDSIIIGRLLGVDSMSAYGLALPLLTLLIALGTMIC
jgi:Na+-driven multidrug efflux pump